MNEQTKYLANQGKRYFELTQNSDDSITVDSQNTKYYKITENSDGSININNRHYFQGTPVTENEDGTITYQDRLFCRCDNLYLTTIGPAYLSWDGSNQSSGEIYQDLTSYVGKKAIVTFASGYGGALTSTEFTIQNGPNISFSCTSNSDITGIFSMNSSAAFVTIIIGGSSSAPAAGTATSASLIVIDY